MCRQARETVNATEDLITVAWENHLQKFYQEFAVFRAPREAIQTRYTAFPRRPWRTGLKAAQRTDLGTFLASQKRLHEVVRGPHACLCCRLHLPTSSCSNLWRNQISDRGGGLISAEQTGREICEREFNIAVLSPTVARAVGERSESALKRKRRRKKGNTFDPLGFTTFFFFLILRKIWPIMSWTPARLQPRGPSCLLLLFRCLPVMEMVNILHAFKRLRLKNNNNNNTDDCRCIHSWSVLEVPVELHTNLVWHRLAP